MSTHLLPSVRRQQLVLDFASLLPLLPDGIYLSLSPSNPALWSGVLFVRDPGPYESLIARFTIYFPPRYPEIAPLVTFQTDIFHPLIVPLTTYAFSGSWDSVGVSAGDVQARLPPGAFSLRHGFPHWFAGAVSGAGAGSARSSLNNTSTANIGLGLATSRRLAPNDDHNPRPGTQEAVPPSNQHTAPRQQHLPDPDLDFSSPRTTTLALLTHVLSSFTDPTLLDALPLSSAANPSAWHAWRSYRPATSPTLRPNHPSNRDAERVKGQRSIQSSPRQPSEWNWDGVFESRVREGVENSVSDATLFGLARGGGGGNIGPGRTSKTLGQGEGQIRFEKLDSQKLEEIRRDIRQGRTLVS